jgi:hypothetical protein
MRILAARAKNRPDIALVLAQLGVSRTRQGLALLLDRRLVRGLRSIAFSRAAPPT